MNESSRIGAKHLEHDCEGISGFYADNKGTFYQCSACFHIKDRKEDTLELPAVFICEKCGKRNLI